MRWIVVMVAVLLSGCDFIAKVGQSFDDVCIVGKLTEADAVMLRAAHPKWVGPAPKANDRVLNGDCSAASRAVTQPQ
jgi:hypothetical protein